MSVVTLSVPVMGTPGSEVVGTGEAPTVIEAVVPGATVPELGPWMARIELTVADHVKAALPVFCIEYVLAVGAEPHETMPKSTGVVVSIPPGAPPSARLPSKIAPSNPPSKLAPASGCEPELPKHPPSAVVQSPDHTIAERARPIRGNLPCAPHRASLRSASRQRGVPANLAEDPCPPA